MFAALLLRAEAPAIDVSSIVEYSTVTGEYPVQCSLARRHHRYKEDKASGKLQSQRKSLVHRVAGGGDLKKPLLS